MKNSIHVQEMHDAKGVGGFAFCDKSSGAIRFQVRAGTNGELPVEEAASLLAMHCLVRAQNPDEYLVLMVPRHELMSSVGVRAQEFLTAGRTAAGSKVKLSPRQREVLDHVLRDCSNKEIGARLNVTERTVKFHVSRLLAKFKARDRAGLKHEAAVGMLPASAAPGDTFFGFSLPAELAAAETAQPKSAGKGPMAVRQRASLLDFSASSRQAARRTTPSSDSAERN